jgi:hypothetical protein
MPIRRYVEEGVFSSEALTVMGKAFEAAMWSLGTECGETKREAVAKFIIRLARNDGSLMGRPYILAQSRNSAVRSRPCSSITPDTAYRPAQEAETSGARTSVSSSPQKKKPRREGRGPSRPRRRKADPWL